MKYDVPLPRLLDSTGGEVRRLNVYSASVKLALKPLSTASLKLPKGENVPARAYIEMFTPLGSAGIFRVSSPGDAYGDDVTNVELEHAIAEVGDYLVKGNITGMMAAKTAMQSVFSHYGGTKWQLGSVAALGSGEISMQVQYERVLDAMLEILEQKPGYRLAFDFTTTPWTVSVVACDTTVTAEGRLSRNVNSAKISYDDTELCTRVWYEQSATTDTVTKYYPVFSASTLYSAGSYVRRNNKLYILPSGHQKGVVWANTTKTAITNIPTTVWMHKDADTISTYGVVERTLSISLNYTAEEAGQVADEYLAAHKQPQVSIEVNGSELSSVTGETLDAFTTGKLMRLALPDYNLTVEKTITSVEWDSVYDNSSDMTVYLAYEENTLSTFIHDIDAKGGGRGGGGAKKKEEQKWSEYITDFKRDNYHFDLVAQRITQTEDVLQQAGLYIDSNSVLAYADDNEKNIGAKIKVQADRITQEITDRSNAEETLSSRITQNANSITLKVSKGAIASTINQTAQSVLIQASKIDLDGYVTVSQLAATNAEISNLKSGQSSFVLVSAGTVDASIVKAHDFYYRSKKASTAYVNDTNGNQILVLKFT